MTWARKFAKPIALKDGRTILTLGEARELMLSVPEPQLRMRFGAHRVPVATRMTVNFLLSRRSSPFVFDDKRDTERLMLLT